MRAEQYPLTMVKHNHGNLIAHSADEERQYLGLGWLPAKPSAPAYGIYPMWLEADGLQPLLVEGPDQVQDAVAKGYRLPDDAAIAAAKAGFAASHAAPVEEEYVPQRYPLSLRHPWHRDAIPVSWIYDIDGVGTAIPGVPEQYPDKVVNNPGEERAACALGWSGPALPPDEPDRQADTDDQYAEFLAWKRAGGRLASTPAARKRPSGAQFRKRRREQRQIGAT